MEVKESQLKMSWTYENKEIQNCSNMQETYNPENNCQRQKKKGRYVGVDCSTNNHYHGSPKDETMPIVSLNVNHIMKYWQ